MNKVTIERIVGFALFALLLIAGGTGFFARPVLFQGLIGFGLGYALIRGDFGFAGLSNRTWRQKSTKLIQALMFMFVLSAAIVLALVLTNKVDYNKFWINPISWGLLAGGLLFGIGMSFSSCCATGVLQDIPGGLVRGLVTLFFFGMGVYIALPWMASDFVKKGIFGTDSNIAGRGGNWIPDWFGGATSAGFVWAFVVTVVFALAVVFAAKWFEKRLNDGVEAAPEVTIVPEEDTEAYRLFTKKWSMLTTATVIAFLFGLLTLVSGGWGASTIHGFWFGRFLMIFGVDAQVLADYTGKGIVNFNGAFFENGGNVRNLSIIIGAFAAMLIAGTFTEQFKAGLKVKPVELALFALGGLLLGIGTRLSMGCNVGALYTPIAQFSFTGWLYFIILFAGGYVGNIIYKWFYKTLVK